MYTIALSGALTRDADGAFIPADPGNADYAAYLAWLAAGSAASPPDIGTYRGAQITALTAAYQSAIFADVPYMGTTFQADDYSQTLVTKCLSPGAVPNGFFWNDTANNQVPMTYAQLQGLAAVMLQQGQAAFAKLQGYKSQVRNATTIQAVQGVVWQ